MTSLHKFASAPLLEQICATVEQDFTELNQQIPHRLTSDVDMVEEIGRYIVESGGKRLRPLLVLLAARCCGYAGRKHITLAAVIEFLHTATLLHDDVIDHSELRRGRATVNALWGNSPSVLVGDFLYSRAFQMMVEIGDMRIMEILSEATNVIAEGEVMQLDHAGDPGTTEERYREVIRAKTAMLFQAAAHTAAVLTGDDASILCALRDFGLHLGMAFQLVDDMLDYSGDTAVMGKNVGDDLAEGKATLPLIFAMRCGASEDARLIREAIRARSAAHLDQVFNAVRRSGALEYTHQMALAEKRRALRCLDALPDNHYRDALANLAEFTVSRAM
ncbi:MAG: polyprenyl synthetase family protein [Gammaproteobacteria bacterium]|jgi:octaprenyl-diphosphate synthase